MGYSPKATQTPVIYKQKSAHVWTGDMCRYLLGHFLHVAHHEGVALGVEERGEAPRVLECDQV